MITVTEAACAHLAALLDREGAPEEVAVRFVWEDGVIGLRPDGARDGDTVFDYEGRTVLVIDESVAEMLAEDTLDVEEAKLTLSRPESSEE